MKSLLIAFGVSVLCATCRQTTSPSVPKAAIEQAANTTIEDAGTADAGK